MKLIPLSQLTNCKRKSLNLFAQVDDKDYENLSKHNWFAFPNKKSFYAKTNIKNGKNFNSVSMHRIIMGLEIGDSQIIDHRDGNGLNNQRDNLRLCSHRQNAMNRKGRGKYKYLGVSEYKYKDSIRWRALLRSNGKNLETGYFKSEENAAIAYNIFAEKHHGEFARYNTVNT